MSVLMRCGLWLVCALCFSCAPDPKVVAATAVVVEVQAEPIVRSAMTSLRVRTSSEQDGAWVKRNEQVFSATELQWPVDFVMTPRVGAKPGDFFEVIVEALDKNQAVLVQARALTNFVTRESRVLNLTLSTCGTLALGVLCEAQADCYGPECQTCVNAACATTPVTPATSLAPFDATDDAGAPGDAAVRSDATFPGDPRARDSGARDDAAVGDAGTNESDGDAQVTDVPDAQITMPDAGSVTCDHGYVLDAQNHCVDQNECELGLDDCSDSPDACLNDVGSFHCACPAGYTGAAKGAGGCVDADECALKTAKCDPLAECHNTDGSYTCGACAAGYIGGANGVCTDACLSNNGGCASNATCNHPAGSAISCSCPAGTSGSGMGAGGCVDVCSINNGGCSSNATCSHQGAAISCACAAGTSGSGMGASGCADVCSINNGGCSSNATCSHQGAAISCACAVGTTGSGMGAGGCVDLCSVNNGGCNKNANCSHQGAAVSCTCPPPAIGPNLVSDSGFEGQGSTLGAPWNSDPNNSVSPFYVITLGHGSAKAVDMQFSQGSVTMWQRVAVNPNSHYRLSAWGRGSAIDAVVTVATSGHDNMDEPNGGDFATAGPFSGVNWMSASVEFDTGAFTSFVVTAHAYTPPDTNNHTFDLDDITLQQIVTVDCQ